MRLCIANEYFYPDSTGGTAAVLSNLARALRDNYDDVEIDVITTRHLYRATAGALDAYQDWDGINIIRVKTPAPERDRAIKRVIMDAVFSMKAFLRMMRNRYDLVVVDTAPPSLPLAARLYRLLTGTPYIYIVYDLEPDRAVVMKVAPGGHPAVKLLRAVQRDWMRAASKVVVIGRCMRDYVARTYRIPGEDLEVIPNGFDPEEVFPMGRDTRFRAEQDIKGFVALYSGNFGRYHNFDTVLDAAKRLQADGKDVTFVLVGNGARKEHIEQRIADEGITNVRLFPFVPADQYSDLLASADVTMVTLEPQMEGLCVPSKFYGLLAAGRPILGMVSPTSEIALAIDENSCGEHVPQGDADALIGAITRLYDDPVAAARMGNNARRALVREYTCSHIADRFYRLFKAALGQPMPAETPAEAPVRATADR